MKLPSRTKSTFVAPHPAMHLLQMQEQMKGSCGTSPTQRAYRSHTSDLIARLDLLLAPKKSKTSTDAKKLADALGAKPSAGPPKSRARNIVLRDLVDILTKIWRDGKSLDLIEGKRDEIVPSPPVVEDGAPISEVTVKAEVVDELKKATIKTENVEAFRTALSEEAFTEMSEVDLSVGAFNHGEPFMQWIPASQTAGVYTAAIPSVAIAEQEILSSFLEEHPVDLKQEDSCCTSPSSEEEFDDLMIDEQTPPESPFEEICAPSK
eukprot:2132504-Rhodomonas_salina.1